MWTTLQISGFGYFSHVADSCIKLSTQPCNLHRQTLTVEWPYWRAQWVFTWHRHRMPPFQSVRQISALLELRWSTVSAVIVKWKCLCVTMAQPRCGRSHELTEWDHRVLKRVACKKILCPWLQHSLPSSKLPLEATSALFVRRFMKWFSMAEQPHSSLISTWAMPSFG